MEETCGTIWDASIRGDYFCIPTNGIVDKHGMAVMGAGLAKQASYRFSSLRTNLGRNLSKYGNEVFFFPTFNLFTFPTKSHWKDDADINLIERSAIQLVDMADKMFVRRVCLPAVGCGLGGLSWDDVGPILHKHLDDRFYAIIN